VANGSERGLRIAAALAALLIVAIALPVDASVLRGMTVKQLRGGADTIVTGKVVAVRAVVADGLIETVARVRVSATHKGTVGRIVSVRVPGGFARGKRLLVPGAPTLQRGDELLLFLYQSGADWRPVGLFQGVWKLDPSNPDAALASDSGGAALMRAGAEVLATDRERRALVQLVGGAR